MYIEKKNFCKKNAQKHNLSCSKTSLKANHRLNGTKLLSSKAQSPENHTIQYNGPKDFETPASPAPNKVGHGVEAASSTLRVR